MLARRVLGLALLGAVLGPAPVTADHLDAALEQPLAEISHHVEARVDDGVATYVVQRQFKNRGAIADEVRLEIELPDGAAATGLRIRAGTVWHAGELLEAQQAARTYRALTGRGVATLKDPALLWYRGHGRLFLQVFPVKARGGVTMVEYTLTVPTRYERGRYWLTYPRGRAAEGSLALVDPTISVRALPGATAPILLDGKRLAAGTRTRIAALPPVPAAGDPVDETAHAELGIAPPTTFAGAPWVARLGRVVASDQHAFARLEVDVAPEVAPLPKRAQVVFVLDASYSIGEDGLAAQLAMVRAYARHVPDAEVELVASRRTAQRVFGAFVPATRLGPALEAATRRGRLALGNGSALDAGARLAAEALRGRSGPHRVVIATDELVRTSLDEALAVASVAALDPAAVVHVVVPSSDGELALARDDAGTLAAVATKHHGIFARLGGLRGARIADVARPVLELVRPVRIDHVAITHGFTADETLAEGEGLRLVCRAGTNDCAKPAPTGVVLTGQLWSDPIRLAVQERPAFSQATAAFVIGASLADDLSDAEVMTIARQGRAVSRVTSYLAIEPGVRPSKEGLPEGGDGFGWGTIGTGSYGTIGRHGYSSPTAPNLHALVDTRACDPLADGAPLTVAVETTRDEIVDVLPARTGAFATCVVEAVWKTRLDGLFVTTRQTHQLLFP